jgi:hypothetical protein
MSIRSMEAADFWAESEWMKPGSAFVTLVFEGEEDST